MTQKPNVQGPWRELVAVLLAPALAVALAAAVFALLPGCGASQADAYRADVNAAADDLTQAAYGVALICNVRGKESEECKALTKSYNAARKSTIAAHKAVDAYEQIGAGSDLVGDVIGELREMAKRIKGNVKAAVEALSDAVATVAGEPSGPRGQGGSGGTDQAEGSGAPHPADAGEPAQ